MSFRNNEFICTYYMEHGATGTGASPEDYAPIASGTMFNLPDGVVVTDAHAIVEVAVTGATALDVGDGSDADAFIAAASITLGTPAVYPGAGASLDAVRYSSALDVDLTVTGTSTAGRVQVILRGYRT